MSDAHERIWAGVLTDEYRGMTGTRIRVWGDDPRVGTDDPAIEYIRADLVEALRAENQRLRVALRACEEALDLHGEMSPHMVKGYTLSALNGARAALRSTETNHDD